MTVLVDFHLFRTAAMFQKQLTNLTFNRESLSYIPLYWKLKNTERFVCWLWNNFKTACSWLQILLISFIIRSLGWLAVTLLSFAVSRISKWEVQPLLWPDSGWDPAVPRLCECRSVSFSIFAHIHRLHFSMFPPVEAVAAVGRFKKAFQGEVGVM